MGKQKEIESRLRPYVSLVSSLPGGEQVLLRTAHLMNDVGNPQDSLKVIHIAGTSGKTSTAYYISALLKEAGLKVGLAVSPHVDKVNERAQINGDPLSDQKFLGLLNQFLSIVEQGSHEYTYFELLYCFSFWVFANEKVDYAVVETGIGGLRDATNIARRRDKVCVITDIGYDHMDILGKDISQIAAQKAGIIHEGNTAIVVCQTKEINEQIKKRAKTKKAQVLFVEPQSKDNEERFIKTLPIFQKRNWLVAKRTYDFLVTRDHLPTLSDQALQATQKTYIPARMEVRKFKGKVLIMDGAHNIQKLESLVESFAQGYPNQKASVVLALKHSKDAAGIAEVLSPVASSVITTSFYATKDLPSHAIDAVKLAGILSRSGLVNVIAEPDQQKALTRALSQESNYVIITGSFYLLSQLRATFLIS